MYYLHCMLLPVLNIFIQKEAVPQESHVLSTPLCCIIQIISLHFSLKHLGSYRFIRSTTCTCICYICNLVSLEVHQSSKEFHTLLISSSRCWQERALHTPVWHSVISVLSLFLWLSQPSILMSMLSGKQLNLSCTNWLLGWFLRWLYTVAVLYGQRQVLIYLHIAYRYRYLK